MAARAGDVVELRRPLRLRGRSAVLRRAVGRRWEVEVRTPLGTPLHLTVGRHAFRPAA